MRVLTLPDGEVSHGLSPDGRVVVTRNPKSNVVTLLDIESGESRALGTGGTMPEVAFSADSRELAALRLPEGLRVWDLVAETDRVLGVADGAHVEVEFDPAGGIVVYGRNAELHRWKDDARQRLGPHIDRVVHVAVSPSGRRAATVDAARQTRLWNLETLAFEELPGAGPVAFATDGRIAWVSEDGSIAVSDPAAAGESPISLAGADAPIEVLAFSPAGTRIACGTIEGEVRWWSTSGDADSRPQTLPGASAHVASLRWIDDELLATTTLEDLALHPLDGGPAQVLQGHEGVGFWAARDDAHLVTVGHEGTVRVWDRRRSPMRSLEAHEGEVAVLAATGGGSWVTADDRGVVLRWDAELEKSERFATDPSGAPIVAIAGGPDGAIAWANDLGEVRVRDETSSDSSILTEREEGVLDVRWGHGEWLITTETALIRSGGASGGSAEAQLDGLNPHWVAAPGGPGWRAIVSSDEERYFVVTSRDGEALEQDELPTEGVMAAAFAPDGSLVAFSGFDRSVAVWDASSREVRELGRHAGLVRAVDVSPDASTVISAGDDGVVKLWDVETGRVRTVPMGRRSFQAVAVSGAGERFVALSLGSDGAAAFVGRDDLPRTRDELRSWVGSATDLEIEPQPIDWVVR